VRFISERLSDALCTIVIMRQIDGQCLSCAAPSCSSSPSFLSFSSSSRVSCSRQTPSHGLLVSECYDSLSNSKVLRYSTYFESVICTKYAVRLEKCIIQMLTNERLPPLNGCLQRCKQLIFYSFVHTEVIHGAYNAQKPLMTEATSRTCCGAYICLHHVGDRYLSADRRPRNV